MIPLSLSAYQQAKYDRRKNSGIIHNDHRAAENYMKLICIQIDSPISTKSSNDLICVGLLHTSGSFDYHLMPKISYISQSNDLTPSEVN